MAALPSGDAAIIFLSLCPSNIHALNQTFGKVDKIALGNHTDQLLFFDYWQHILFFLLHQFNHIHHRHLLLYGRRIFIHDFAHGSMLVVFLFVYQTFRELFGRD